MERLGTLTIIPLERLLDVPGTFHCGLARVEGCHDAVSKVLHLASLEAGEGAADERVMGSYQLGGPGIAQTRSHFHGLDDIREHDRPMSRILDHAGAVG